MTNDFTLKSAPFDWNDNFSEIAIEDFDLIRDKLSYGTCQTIGLALAKLDILEKQGCKVGKNKPAVEVSLSQMWMFCDTTPPPVNQDILLYDQNFGFVVGKYIHVDMLDVKEFKYVIHKSIDSDMVAVIHPVAWQHLPECPIGYTNEGENS